MASRNFCDLCGTEIGKDVVYFSVEGDHVNNSEFPADLFLRNGVGAPFLYHGMVCKTCYVTIRNAILDLQK